MTKHIHVLRVIGNRIAKVQRYSDRGFFMMVALDEKLAEGRQVRLNKYGCYSDFYDGCVHVGSRPRSSQSLRASKKSPCRCDKRAEIARHRESML